MEWAEIFTRCVTDRSTLDLNDADDDRARSSSATERARSHLRIRHEFVKNMSKLSGKGENSTRVFAERLEKVATGQATLAQAVGLTRDQLYSIAGKGYQLLNQGKLDDARMIYEGLVAADPFDSVFHCHLAAVLWRSGNEARAFEEYDAAVRFNIANVDALAGRGELFLLRGEAEKGVEDLSRALEIDPKCSRPSTQRARALLFSIREATKATSRSQIGRVGSNS